MRNIRNFVIIAHIDHGKSTLADRLLEVTGTVPGREMRPQYLDQLDLERERGITIKMAPVRMEYRAESGEQYVLNLIDTPGHNDFAYEVSRALRAVEGAVLLVDATQGIQAQTLANYEAAKRTGLTVIGCVNKVDLNPPDLDRVIATVAELVGCREEEVVRVSGKTGEGVPRLLETIVREVPPPEEMAGDRALIFDSVYDEHKGIIAFARVFSGSFTAGKATKLATVGAHFSVKEVGVFSPKLMPTKTLEAGGIGYIATGIKDPGVLRIGDTIGATPLPGYALPRPVVFVSLYPEDGDEYDALLMALNKLRLVDSSLSVAPDVSEVLGRGFKVGFLGKLHFEIATERLAREFNLDVVTSFPSVAYRVRTPEGDRIIENPKELPDTAQGVEEPMVKIVIITPEEYLGKILGLTETFKLRETETETMERRVKLSGRMPLVELISDFDDTLKSLSLGYASFSYEPDGYEPANVVKMEVILAGEPVPGLTRIVYAAEVERVGRRAAEELKELLPKTLFAQAIQVSARGRIVARETIPPLKKDVTGHLYGGDRTRKMKLWKKQQKGKKRLKERGRVTIPPEIFKALLKK